MDDPVLGNLCEECDCHGSIVVYHSAARSWETGEYLDTEEVVCPVCDGLGYLTTPLVEADVTIILDAAPDCMYAAHI